MTSAEKKQNDKAIFASNLCNLMKEQNMDTNTLCKELKKAYKKEINTVNINDYLLAKQLPNKNLRKFIGRALGYDEIFMMTKHPTKKRKKSNKKNVIKKNTRTKEKKQQKKESHKSYPLCSTLLTPKEAIIKLEAEENLSKEPQTQINQVNLIRYSLIKKIIILPDSKLLQLSNYVDVLTKV